MGGQRITVRLADEQVSLLKKISRNESISDGVHVLFDTYSAYRSMLKEHEDLQRQVFDLSDALASLTPLESQLEGGPPPLGEKPSTSKVNTPFIKPLPEPKNGATFSPDEVESSLNSIFSFVPESHRSLIVHLTKLFYDSGKWLNAVPANWISFGTFGDAINDLVRDGIIEWHEVNGTTVMLNPLLTLRNNKYLTKQS